MEPVDVIKLANGTLEIISDEDPQNPRTEWDNLGTMVCFHKRYGLGDTHDYKSKDYDNWNAVKAQIVKDHDPALILPLYMMDHSGLTIRCDCNAFQACDSAGWDWGQIGFIFVSKDKVRNEWGVKRITKKLLSLVNRSLRGEVEVYDQYVRGDVYGYRFMDSDGEELDSCWGFFGSDPIENGMVDSLPEDARQQIVEQLGKSESGEQKALIASLG